LLVKSMCTDFVSFSLIRHVLVQRCTLVTAVCNFSVDSLLLSPMAMIAISSANMATKFTDDFERISERYLMSRYHREEPHSGNVQTQIRRTLASKIGPVGGYNYCSFS
jgi:hypothetical protein